MDKLQTQASEKKPHLSLEETIGRATNQMSEKKTHKLSLAH